MCYKRQPLGFLFETGPERIQILRHSDGTIDWLSVSSFVYYPIRMSRLLLFSALNYLFCAPCYQKTAFFSANHNREIFSRILLKEKQTERNFWPKPWKSRVVYEEYNLPVYLSLYKKNETKKKFPIFYQNHWLTPLEKCQFFVFLLLLFLV